MFESRNFCARLRVFHHGRRYDVIGNNNSVRRRTLPYYLSYPPRLLLLAQLIPIRDMALVCNLAYYYSPIPCAARLHANQYILCICSF
jgi:hypothetical protein